MMIRAFIGFKIGPSLQKEFAVLLDKLKSTFNEGRPKWVEPGNLHLTLKFIGDIEPESVLSIEEKMESAFKGFSPFALSFGSLGVFPGPRKPRVLWSSVVEGKSHLIDLQSRLETGLTALGFPRERKPYHPHLTLARFREPHNVHNILSLLRDVEFTSSRARVENVVLFQSILQRQGPIYKSLQEIKL